MCNRHNSRFFGCGLRGSDNGTPFSRQDRAIAIAGVTGNVILDPCDADSDDDGLTDKDEIDVCGPSDSCQIMRANQDRPLDPSVRGDGVISSLDLLAVARLSGPNRGAVREDEDGDGAINSLDLMLVARKFLQNVRACP